MTDLKAEAIRLILKMPEVEVDSIIELLRKKATPVDPEEKKRKAQAAFQHLHKFMGRLPADFDYKKELEEALEEKYLRHENLG